MSKVNRIVSLILAAMLTASLISCERTHNPPDVTDTVPESTADTVSQAEQQLAVKRYHDWENDIFYLADAFLGGHPKLTETSYCYDAELKASFENEINLLLPRIYELSDTEVIYELSRIIANLRDSNSVIDVPESRIFPLVFEAFYEDDGVSLYTIAARAGEDRLMFSRLEAINGIPTDEVLARLSPLVSSESEYYTLRSLTGIFINALITRRDTLAAVGVIGRDDITAEFTMSFEDGSSETVEFTALDEDGLDEIKGTRAEKTLFSAGALMFQNYGEYCWHTYVPEDNMVYVRITYCYDESGMWSEVMRDIKEAPEPPKVVFDLRLNYGGRYPMSGFDGFLASLANTDTDGVYILIDGSVRSVSAATAAAIKQKIDGSLILGIPGGGSPNATGSISRYTMPRTGCGFYMSSSMHTNLKEYGTEPIMPDIAVYPTVEDYKDGIDTILEYVKNAGAE